MKKYKLIKGKIYTHLKEGETYLEDFKETEMIFSVGELVALYPSDWELIKDEFVLPEKWKVRPSNEEEDNILVNWRGGSHIGKIGKSYMTSDRCWYAIDADYIDKFIEITFEQFKTHVLNMKEEKEIIGYKLKNDYKGCRDAALKLCNTIANWENSLMIYDISIKQKNYVSKLTEAGVLNLWFEPVYKQEEPEYKIGDFVKVTKNGCNASQFNRSNIIYGVYSNKNWENEVYTISSKPKFYDGEDYVKNDWVYELKNSKDEVAGNVYSQALRKATEEEIKAAQTPQITINGYKGEFFDDYVKFGCAIINKQYFIDLYSFASKSYKGQNRGIETITIGRGTFSKEQIKEIAEYYLNKDK